jgi:hypothetical protein
MNGKQSAKKLMRKHHTHGVMHLNTRKNRIPLLALRSSLSRVGWFVNDKVAI